jgi:DMSO/TMAO reductase YedYZ molybdopterin-dependent catalytic subunit
MKKLNLQSCLLSLLFGLIIIEMLAAGVSASMELNLQVADFEGNSVNFSYDQLLAMPKTDVYASLYCYGNLVTSGNWGGVTLSYLLQQAGVNLAAASVSFEAQDGYRVAIPTGFATRQDVIIAYEKNDLPLAEGLRLVIPEQNGNIWIAAITKISTSTTEVSFSQQVVPVPLPRIYIPEPTTSAPQSPAQQQTPLQPQPTPTPKKETSPEPVIPPATVTQPEQKSSASQTSDMQDFGFPLLLGLGVVLGSVVAIVTLSQVTYKRKLRKHEQEVSKSLKE